MGKRACIAFALGCPRSEMDAVWLRRYLEANDWETTNDLRGADVVFVATCGVDERHERKSLEFLRIAKARKRQDARLFVMGCLPGIVPDLVRAHCGGVPLPPKSMSQLDTLLDAKVGAREIKDPNFIAPTVKEFRRVFSFLDQARARWKYADRAGKPLLRRLRPNQKADPRYALGHDVFSIRLARGCLDECSYCAVRFACGPFHSKPFDDVMAEFDDGLRQGCRVFRLVAQDVGAYGQDIGLTICDLLRAMFQKAGDFQITWSDFNPRWLVDQSKTLCEIIGAHAGRLRRVGFPIESGSDRILRLMNRRYTARETRQALRALREAAPGLWMSTHLLVGFPGETDEDMAETASVLREVDFDLISIFEYSERPGVASANLPDKVPAATRRRRIRALRRAFPSA